MDINNFVQFANEVHEESQEKINKFIAWENYIKPKVKSRFGLDFQSEIQHLYKKEAKEFIKKQRKVFEECYQK